MTSYLQRHIECKIQITGDRTSLRPPMGVNMKCGFLHSDPPGGLNGLFSRVQLANSENALDILNSIEFYKIFRDCLLLHSYINRLKVTDYENHVHDVGF